MVIIRPSLPSPYPHPFKETPQPTVFSIDLYSYFFSHPNQRFLSSYHPKLAEPSGSDLVWFHTVGRSPGWAELKPQTLRLGKRCHGLSPISFSLLPLWGLQPYAGFYAKEDGIYISIQATPPPQRVVCVSLSILNFFRPSGRSPLLPLLHWWCGPMDSNPFIDMLRRFGYVNVSHHHVFIYL